MNSRAMDRAMELNVQLSGLSMVDRAMELYVQLSGQSSGLSW